ncbi:unnamed protein product, partial [Scytosiphon promiscuus]
QLCIQRCRDDGAVFVAMVRGNVCICVHEIDPDALFPERWTGVCTSPCLGDATRTCGGEDSIDLFKLSYEQDGKDNAQETGLGTSSDSSNGPSTKGSMYGGAGSIGSTSPAPEETTGATSVTAAAPESSAD